MEESKMTKEQKLIIEVSRYSNVDKNKVKELIYSEINWNKVLTYAIKNKILGLLFRNIKMSCPFFVFPGEVDKLLNFYYEGNKKRNKLFMREAQHLKDVFVQNNILFTPLKGSFLIPNIYIDGGSRTMNDIDILISSQYTDKLKKILYQEGYIQGDYNIDTGEIIPLTRDKDLLYKMQMNNLYVFKKRINSPYLGVIDIDVCFNIDLKIRDNLVDEMLGRSNTVNGITNLSPCDFMLHLCSHLYKEATNAMWIQLEKDMALIKFCDVREYYLKYVKENDEKNLLSIVDKNIEYKKAIYYTIFFLEQIFHDGYEQKILNRLDLKEDYFIYQFGGNDFKDKQLYWKKDFFERVFSDNNKDELPDKPIYNKFIEEI